MTNKKELQAILARVECDLSHGAGTFWRPAHLEADAMLFIREEITAVIMDSKQTSCPDYLASNGQHYRW